MIERAHVVNAVGELDENHAHVLPHRQQHLAKVFRLFFLPAAEIRPAEFGNAVH